MAKAQRPGHHAKPRLSVSILAADLLNLGSELDRLQQHGVEMIHFDIMDGRFCPDLTAGTWFIQSIKTRLIKDVHLLVVDPENWIRRCIDAGAGIITVHVESGTHVRRALEMITENATAKDSPPLRGVAICPGTPIQALAPVLEVADIVYVLGINPGWRQPMVPVTTQRAHAVRELIDSSGRKVLLAIDGGVTVDNFPDVAAMKPDLVVSGSAVFANGDLETNLARFAENGAGLGLSSGDPR